MGRKLYRQGDVILREIEWLKSNPALKYLRAYGKDKVLELSGETGHVHRISGRLEDTNTILLLEEPAEMTHPHHDALQVPRGYTGHPGRGNTTKRTDNPSRAWTKGGNPTPIFSNST
jgi:hypothetical protein